MSGGQTSKAHRSWKQRNSPSSLSLVSAAGIPHQSCQDSHSTPHEPPYVPEFRDRCGHLGSICHLPSAHLSVDSEDFSGLGQGNLSSITCKAPEHSSSTALFLVAVLHADHGKSLALW